MRLVFACALVFLTYNPSGYSWVGWLMSETAMVYKVAAGVVLLIGWAIFLRATWNSLGAVGTVLAGAFFAVIIWLLIEWDLIALDNSSTFVWGIPVCAEWSACRRHVMVARASQAIGSIRYR